MNEQINIRGAIPADVNQLAELFDKYRIFYEYQSDLVSAEKFLSERIERSDSIIFVAEASDAKLVGFVQLYPLFSSTRMKKLWLLNDLFVDGSFRGRGISILLIDRAKFLTRESSAVGLTLETAKSNVIGNELYPRVGFHLDVDHNYYIWNAD